MKSRLFLYISLAADILIAVSKFIGSSVTGSASMTAEAVHSVIDAVSQLLLIWGVKRSKQPADASRPFGYGRELYYWSLIVSLVIFVLGGCISIYEGIKRTNDAHFEGRPDWNYAILGIAFLFNFISMIAALKAFNKERKAMPFWTALVRTKDPSTIIVLLGDIGDLLGLVFAFLGIYLGRLFNNPTLDGYASIAIGVLLLVISGFLIRESKSLLLGESIGPKTKRAIIKMAGNDEAVLRVKKVSSIYRSPEDAMVLLHLQFHNKMNVSGLKTASADISLQIKKAFPQIKEVVISAV